MADQDLLLDLYVQNHALPPCCGTRRRDGGIVWRWPEPKEVEEALLPAFALAGDHQPLSEAECKSVGWLFAFPNLVHWLLHMHAPKAGTPHVDGCPMPTPADGCDEVHGPEHVVVRDGHDFCRQRFHKHPWALQVSLLWSGEQRRRAPTRDQDKPPSRACAWAVYLGILDNPRVRQRWTQLGPNPRPEPVRQRWDLLVQGIENVVATAPTGDAPGFCRALAKGLLPRFLVGLCMVVNNAADLVRRRQRNLPNELKERIEQVVRALAVPFLLHYKAKWALRTERYLQQVDGLRKLLSELDAPGTDKVLAILGAGRLNRVLQRVVIEYLRDVVLPYRAQGLPGGDPMSDPVVADVFWDWVGGAKRPDSDRRFRPEEWGKRRWRSIGQGEGVPRWRTLE